MTCNCQTCQDLRMLRGKGVPEEFIDRWMYESIDKDVNASILCGSWPTAVEFLETALENAKKIRGDVE